MKFLFKCFLIFSILLGTVTTLLAQRVELGARQLKAEEATSILNEFRKYRLPGDFCMKIKIVHKPRKSDDEKIYSGTIFGTWNEKGPALRIEMYGNGETKKFLIQSGKNPKLWTCDKDGNTKAVDADSTQAFWGDLIFTPFDLQTPFLFWEDFKYEETKRSRGRLVHFFKMFPPKDFKEMHPEIEFVRIGFDRVYNALVRVEVYGENNEKMKSFSIVSVQKAQEIYTFKELELRNDKTRDKDTLLVKKVALRLNLPAKYFSPEALSEEMPKIDSTRFSELN